MNKQYQKPVWVQTAIREDDHQALAIIAIEAKLNKQDVYTLALNFAARSGKFRHELYHAGHFVVNDECGIAIVTPDKVRNEDE